MHLDKTWWVKINPTFYILDLALLLVLFQQINVNTPYLNFPRDYLQDNVRQTLEVQLLQHSFAMPDLVRTFKINALLKDSLYKHDNHNKSFEFSGSSKSNITVHMVLVTPLEREENISTERSLHSDPILTADQEFFHVEETYRQSINTSQSTNTNNVFELINDTNSFTETEDVRWRQYLNTVNDTQSTSKCCETNYTKNNDLSNMSNNPKEEGFHIEVFNGINSESNEIVGCSSNSKLSPDMSLHYNDMFNHLSRSQGGRDSVASSSKTLMFQPTMLNAHNSEDADLMQMLYEQDIDLGYNWQNSDPVKQLKDPNDVSMMKTDSLNLNNFSIDGETGELIPISQNANQQQNEAPRLAPATPQLSYGNNSFEASNATLDLEECLEILENSIDDLRPSKPTSQKSIEECNNMVRNLTSFIDIPLNTTVQSDPNTGLWQQIDELSDLTNLNLREENQTIASPSCNEVNGNLNCNGQTPMPTVEQRNMGEQFSFTPREYNGVAQSLNTSMFDPGLPQSYPVLGFPENERNSPVQPASSYMPAPIASDDGIPMDTSYVPINSAEKQEQNFSGEPFNNFNYQMESSSPGGSSAPVLSSLPEPGQSFFDYLSSEDGAYANATSTASSFQPLPATSFLNPPVSNLSPPPLNQSSSANTLLDELDHQLGSVDKKGAVECYESDSGISLDQSPRGVDFLTLNSAEEAVFTNDVTCLKTEPVASDQGFAMPEFKAVQHNHTYNGTAGVAKPTKKKVDKSASTRESRDEKKARELNLPFTLDEIILSPVEEYNEMLARTPLNPAQQALVKDIRRRGKNKVAAQNCRKRKIETISNMEEDVELMRSKKQQLIDEQKELEIQYENIKLQYSALYRQIFSALRDDAGRPYDPEHFRLEQVEGAVFLVPHQRRNGQSDSGAGDVDFSKVKQERS